jgi:hypothetical protein
MQHVLQKYTLHTCFHPFTNENHNIHEIDELMKFHNVDQITFMDGNDVIHSYFVYVWNSFNFILFPYKEEGGHRFWAKVPCKIALGLEVQRWLKMYWDLHLGHPLLKCN